MDLKLDSGEDFPRRLEVFPKGQLLALGDDDGSLSCIDTTAANCIRTIRQYDDAAVRAATLSSDGKRVAVGFDNGSTRIYKYDEYNSNNNDTEQQQQQQHPFLPPPKANKEDDDDDDNGFLSQPDGGENDMDEEDDEDRCWAGPQVEGPVRDLKFLPNSHWLVIASESGLCVVNVESADTMADRYLQTQVTNEHDGCGIRGIAINDKKWMASLAMDGRLCVWEISGLEQLSNVTDNVPVFRDRTRCVPHKDIGESNDASPSDRSCLPHWVQSDILALPGKAQLQLRSVSVTSDKIEVKESEKKPVPDPSRGHIEPIVALTSAAAASTDDLFVVSSGQDGRVILWKILKDGVSLLS